MSVKTESLKECANFITINMIDVIKGKRLDVVRLYKKK